MEETLLSIVILTRNRKEEALHCLRSCLECALPEGTEFVIIDNHSEDGSREAIEDFFRAAACNYRYFYQEQNLGVAAGRNRGYAAARGRYVYFLDDDAYVDFPKQSFFQKMIQFLEQNPDYFCVTTSMFDTSINGKRNKIRSKNHYGKKVLRFAGGTVMVDKRRWIDPHKLFLEHQIYGMEELYPSLKGYFNRQYVGELADAGIIHNPSSHSRFDYKAHHLFSSVGLASIKLVFYPLVLFPIVYLLFSLRVIKYLGVGGLFPAFTRLIQTQKKLKREPARLHQVLEIEREFGFLAIL